MISIDIKKNHHASIHHIDDKLIFSLNLKKSKKTYNFL